MIVVGVVCGLDFFDNKTNKERNQEKENTINFRSERVLQSKVAVSVALAMCACLSVTQTT